MSNTTIAPVRFTRAKKQLTRLISEMLARVQEVDGQAVGTELWEVSKEAAPLAATLGFPVPPVEYAVISCGGSDAVLEAYSDYTHAHRLRVYDPSGLTARDVLLGMNKKAGQSTGALKLGAIAGQTRTSSPVEITKMLRRWERAVRRLEIEDVQHDRASLRSQVESFEKWMFNQQLQRELAGGIDPNGDEPAIARAMREVLCSRIDWDAAAKETERISQEFQQAHEFVPAELDTPRKTGSRMSGESVPDLPVHQELASGQTVPSSDEVAERSSPTRTHMKVRDQEPKEYVEGYKDIFATLGIKLRDDRAYKNACRAFKRKCEQSDAPVIFRNRKPPIAEKDDLLTWWNSQHQAQEAREQATIDRDATLSNGYEYGRASTEVKPGIAGYIRKRAN